jgi:hypothetical protein
LVFVFLVCSDATARSRANVFEELAGTVNFTMSTRSTGYIRVGFNKDGRPMLTNADCTALLW